jgi:hypothetical protein
MERLSGPARVRDQGGPDRLGAVRAAHGQRGREQDLGDLAVSAAGSPRGHGDGVGPDAADGCGSGRCRTCAAHPDTAGRSGRPPAGSVRPLRGRDATITIGGLHSCQPAFTTTADVNSGQFPRPGRWQAPCHGRRQARGRNSSSRPRPEPDPDRHSARSIPGDALPARRLRRRARPELSNPPAGKPLTFFSHRLDLLPLPRARDGPGVVPTDHRKLRRTHLGPGQPRRGQQILLHTAHPGTAITGGRRRRLILVGP